MKYKIFLSGWLILIISNLGFSQQVKKLEETYQINTNSQLRIINKYGDIEINDWDQNKISITAEIVLNGFNDQKAKQLFDLVEVKISKRGDSISAITVYDDKFFELTGKNYSVDNKKFEVRYKISLPVWMVVKADNKYGDLFISKLRSASIIKVSYGTLKINQLLAPDKENMAQVDLAYSKGSIEECSWLRIYCSYSKLGIDEGKAMVAVSNYSKLFFDQATSLVCESKYDAYEIGVIGNFITESKYSNIKIDKVIKKINLTTKYTDTKVINVSAGFDEINIDNSYGSIRIGVDPQASYEIDAYAKYAGISYPPSENINQSQDNNELRIDGRIGNNPKSESKIKINTHYGGVNLNQ